MSIIVINRQRGVQYLPHVKVVWSWRMLVAYVMVSPLSVTTKLLRVKKDRISPATILGAFFPSPSPIKVFCTI